jgi:hypothetical protein
MRVEGRENSTGGTSDEMGTEDLFTDDIFSRGAGITSQSVNSPNLDLHYVIWEARWLWRRIGHSHPRIER